MTLRDKATKAYEEKRQKDLDRARQRTISLFDNLFGVLPQDVEVEESHRVRHDGLLFRRGSWRWNHYGFYLGNYILFQVLEFIFCQTRGYFYLLCRTSNGR